MYILIICISITLLISAVIHGYKLKNNPEIYTKSFLVDVEMNSLLLLLLLNALNFINFFINILKRRWKEVLTSSICSIFSITIIIVSFSIDVSTLLFMT